MISGKTVELNLTALVIEYLQQMTGRRHFVLAPSTRAEGRLAYDVSIRPVGTGAVIQYKKAHVNPPVWKWELNRTSRRDQHQRLQWLQGRGLPVFYAFPHFHTPREVKVLHRQMLDNTSWAPPLSINPSGGPVGHHDVFFNAQTQRWSVSSPREEEFRKPLTFLDVANALLSEQQRGNLSSLLELANEILNDGSQSSDAEIHNHDALDSRSGFSVIVVE